MEPTKTFIVTLTFEADDTYGPIRMERFMEDHMALHDSDHYRLVRVEADEAPLER